MRDEVLFEIEVLRSEYSKLLMATCNEMHSDTAHKEADPRRLIVDAVWHKISEINVDEREAPDPLL